MHAFRIAGGYCHHAHARGLLKVMAQNKKRRGNYRRAVGRTHRRQGQHMFRASWPFTDNSTCSDTRLPATESGCPGLRPRNPRQDRPPPRRPSRLPCPVTPASTNGHTFGVLILDSGPGQRSPVAPFFHRQRATVDVPSILYSTSPHSELECRTDQRLKCNSCGRRFEIIDPDVSWKSVIGSVISSTHPSHSARGGNRHSLGYPAGKGVSRHSFC